MAAVKDNNQEKAITFTVWCLFVQNRRLKNEDSGSTPDSKHTQDYITILQVYSINVVDDYSSYGFIRFVSLGNPARYSYRHLKQAIVNVFLSTTV